MYILSAIFVLALLAGPLPESKPSLVMRVHVGNGRESAMIRAEMQRQELYFLAKRAYVEQHYRIEIVESQYKLRPRWQIGKAGDKQEFPAGTFNAAGSFMRTLESIAEQDQYDRHLPDMKYNEWWMPFPHEKTPRPLKYPRESYTEEE